MVSGNMGGGRFYGKLCFGIVRERNAYRGNMVGSRNNCEL